jgi:hypothetical protein
MAQHGVDVKNDLERCRPFAFMDMVLPLCNCLMPMHALDIAVSFCSLTQHQGLLCRHYPKADIGTALQTPLRWVRHVQFQLRPASSHPQSRTDNLDSKATVRLATDLPAADYCTKTIPHPYTKAVQLQTNL